MCLHSSSGKNLSEKEDIKPVTSDKDQMFDSKQKKANTPLSAPLTPWVPHGNCSMGRAAGAVWVGELQSFLGQHVSYRLFLSISPAFPAFAKQSASAACRKGCDSKEKLAEIFVYSPSATCWICFFKILSGHLKQKQHEDPLKQSE